MKTTLLSSLLLTMQIARFALADLVLSQKVMKLALTGAELSSLAYRKDPSGDGYQNFYVYTDGACYVMLCYVMLVALYYWKEP